MYLFNLYLKKKWYIVTQGHIILIKSDSKDIYNVTKGFYFK